VTVVSILVCLTLVTGVINRWQNHVHAQVTMSDAFSGDFWRKMSTDATDLLVVIETDAVSETAIIRNLTPY